MVTINVIDDLGQKMDKIKTDMKNDVLLGNDTRYDSAHDASMRLAKSIIRLSGEPIYVKDCLPDQWLICWDMVESSSDFLVYSNDKRLDISSAPLGFVNFKGSCCYAMRNPTRSQKQGIDAQRLQYLDVHSGLRNYSNTGDLLSALSKSIKSEYPDFETGKASQKYGFAISRTWGFAQTPSPNVFLVFHKQYPVALLRDNQDRFLFQRGALTQIRKNSLLNVLVKKGKPGVNYRVEESA